MKQLVKTSCLDFVPTIDDEARIRSSSNNGNEDDSTDIVPAASEPTNTITAESHISLSCDKEQEEGQLEAQAQNRDGIDLGTGTGARLGLNMDAAGTLLDKCITTAAMHANTTASVLKSMAASNKRREMLDDVTIMVLYF